MICSLFIGVWKRIRCTVLVEGASLYLYIVACHVIYIWIDVCMIACDIQVT